MKFSRRSVLAGAFAVGLMTLGTTAAVQAAPSLPSPNGTGALQAQAAQSAEAFIAGHPAVVHPSADEAYLAQPVISSAGLQYVPYNRTYKTLPVIGGDFVVNDKGSGSIGYDRVRGKVSVPMKHRHRE